MQRGANSVKTQKNAAILAMVLTAVFAILAIRILVLQTFKHEEYSQKVLNQLTQEAKVSADRGEIYDRNGILLATNITTYRLLIDPAVIERTSEEDGVDYAEIVARGLSEIEELDIEYGFVLAQTRYTKYRDRTIQRHVMEDVADKVRDFLKNEKLANKGFVFLQATSKRYYPYGSLACHVLGFTNNDGEGIYGLESYYDEYLKGEDGMYVKAKDSNGNEMPYDYESFIAAIDGNDMKITLDVFIQAELEEQLKTSYIESGGKNRAAGMVVDVNTGEVLAMAVYPAFDLNDPWTLNEEAQSELDACGYKEGSDEYNSLQSKLLTEMWSNKCITEPYMPGSTFKIITAAMAYEEDLVNDNETFYCPGYHIVGGRRIRCHKTAGHGSLTFSKGIQQSCNPILMMMGERIGAERFYNYVDNFGYLVKTGIDLPGEGTSIFFKEDSFSSVDLAVSSFGQNFKISVLQHMAAISAVANGGYLITPHLMLEITDQNGNVVKSYEEQVKRQIISPESCATVSAVLQEGVETDGGAKNTYVAGYRIAAKTGTSEKKDEVSTDYTKYVCSTVAYAPADKPEIASIILVDEPTKGTLYGSVVAAPYVGKLMAQALPYLGVEAEYTEEELKKLSIETPTLLYWSVNAATKMAETMGFEVEVIGDGNLVMSQIPAAGMKVEPANAKIILYTTKDSMQDKKTVKVPNLMGLTAAAANGTLANLGLNIKISGTTNYMSGTGALVVEQYPAAGTVVEKGSVIEVTFRYMDDIDYVDN